jgi:outer membrane protein assembly factor BamB
MNRMRALAAWLPALLLVPAGFAVAVHVAQPAEPAAVTRELLPLDVGTTWVYAVSDHGTPSGTHTRQVVGDAGLAGVDATLVNAARVRDTWTDYPGYAGPGERQISSYFAPHGDRIDQYGVISPDHQFQQLDPAAKVYDLLDDVGDSWTYEGTLDVQDISYRTELAERGPVTVGGHTFQGCSHFVTTISVELPDQPKTDETQEEWTCPGVGPVRSNDRYEPTDLDVTEELTEFHGDSGNWYAASSSESGQGDGPGDGPATALGFDSARTNAVADGQVGGDLAWTVGREQASDFPPVSAGDVMVTGDVSGLVSATDVATGEPTWQVQLRPPILVTPAIAGGSVLVADGGKQLRALSLVDGSTRWVHEFDDVVSVSPAVSADADTAAVVTDDGRLSVLEVPTGTVRWEAGRASRASTAPAVSGDGVYVCDEAGNLTAYDLADGDTNWSRSLADGVLLGPVVAGGRVLAQDDGGVIYAFTADDGTLQWQSRTRGLGSGLMAATEDTVVSLIAGDSIVAVDADDGSRTWRRSVPVTKVAPVIVGEEVLTVSAEGRVDTLSLDDGESIASWALPRPVAEQPPVVDVPTALVGDSVVITSDPGTSPAPLTHYAYPLHGTGHGLLLGLDAHVVPDATTEPVTATGGSFYVPGYDGTVTRTGPGAETTELVRNVERVATAPAVAGDLAVVRRDDRLEAVPVSGGDAVWSIQAGNAYAGSTPLVVDDTVYAGASDGRLLAVGLADGKTRWTAPVDAGYLPSTPAVLPDGDVVYGVGLARYDAATGAPVWSLPGVFAYGSPVVEGGAVYAAVDQPDGTAGVGAWDARTGRQLWFSSGVPAAYVGPSVADGVVVDVDAYGTVHAFDARDGTERWTTELHRPAGGVPVIRAGRLYLAGLGIPEEVQPRDYRVAVYDLQTGRFLASWEPPVIGQWIVPFVGPGEPGQDTLLIPTGFSLQNVLMGVRPVG